VTPIPQLPLILQDTEDDRARVTTKMRFRVSVSQLKMFHPGAGGCPRKWALHYLSKVPRLPGLALTDGIRLHECINQHFTLSPDEWAKRWPTFWQPGMLWQDEARVKTAQLALAMINWTPAGRMPALSETTDMLEVPELDTAIYIKPDLQRDHKVFVDWKSTSATSKKSEWCLQDPAFWLDKGELCLGCQSGSGCSGPVRCGSKLPVVTLDSLAQRGIHFLKDDIQARVYAHGLMQFWREVKVTARWVYGSKKFHPTERPKVWIVEHVFHREDTRRWVEQNVWPTIQVMNTIRAAFESGKLDSTLLVPHNVHACEHVGKFCDALGHCGFQESPVAMGKLRLPVLPGSKT
jgi:hypothetical protein